MMLLGRLHLAVAGVLTINLACGCSMFISDPAMTEPGTANGQRMPASAVEESADVLQGLNDAMIRSGIEPFFATEERESNGLRHIYRFLKADLHFSNSTTNNTLVEVTGTHGALPGYSYEDGAEFHSALTVKVSKAVIDIPGGLVRVVKVTERVMSPHEADLFFEYLWRTEIFSLPSEGRAAPDPNAYIDVDIERNHGEYWLFERRTQGRYKLVLRRRSSLGAASDTGKLLRHLATGQVLTESDCMRGK